MQTGHYSGSQCVAHSKASAKFNDGNNSIISEINLKSWASTAHLPVGHEPASPAHDGHQRHIVVRLHVSLHHKIARACRQEPIGVAVAPIHWRAHLHASTAPISGASIALLNQIRRCEISMACSHSPAFHETKYWKLLHLSAPNQEEAKQDVAREIWHQSGASRHWENEVFAP